MKGFFAADAPTESRRSIPLLPACGECQLFKGCQSPKMKAYGKGRKGIMLFGEAPGCISGDSLIDTAYRDKSKHPWGIPIKDLVGQADFFVYSFNVMRQELTLGKVKRVWKTGRKKTYRVTYEWKFVDGNGEVRFLQNSLTVTSNHQFLLKGYIPHDPFMGIQEDLDYLSIDEGLRIGHSLQPFHRTNDGGFGYSYVGAFSKSKVREGRFLLGKSIGRKLIRGEDCHHQDENKLNDEIDNLKLMTTAEHAREHMTRVNPMDLPGARENHRKAMSSEEYRNKMSLLMTAHLADPKNRQVRIENIHNQRERTSQTVKELHNDPIYYFRYLLGRRRRSGYPFEYVYLKFYEKFPDLKTFPEEEPDNHKIISIEYEGVQDVYDMEVEKHHNFAVNGIFVHNSTEDKEGIPFRGPSGRVIRDTLRKFGVDMDRDCWIVNSIRCKAPGNKVPPAAIEHCRPLSVKDIQDLKPRVIIPMGQAAVKSLIGWLWQEDVGMVSRWDGWQIPSQQINAWICPTFHPAALLHQGNHGNDAKEMRDNELRRMFFDRHIQAACELEGRPWDAVPDYKSRVRIVYDPSEAAKQVDAMAAGERPVALDLETTTLSPDGPHAEIYTCALSDGRVSVAFPWHGEAIEAAKRFCLSDIPKLGWHLKFENRWLKKKLGVWVRNWKMDGMIGAHVLDNRPSICSLAFQAFVTLGFVYKDTVSQYLKSKEDSSHAPNRIREAPLDKILEYNALDSLTEWLIDRHQAKQLGVKL